MGKRPEEIVRPCAFCQTPVVLDEQGRLALHRKPIHQRDDRRSWNIAGRTPCPGSATKRIVEEKRESGKKKAA